MSHKKKEKRERPTWAPYFTRKTKTFKEKKEALARKHKNKECDE